MRTLAQRGVKHFPNLAAALRAATSCGATASWIRSHAHTAVGRAHSRRPLVKTASPATSAHHRPSDATTAILNTTRRAYATNAGGDRPAADDTSSPPPTSTAPPEDTSTQGDAAAAAAAPPGASAAAMTLSEPQRTRDDDVESEVDDAVHCPAWVKTRAMYDPGDVEGRFPGSEKVARLLLPSYAGLTPTHVAQVEMSIDLSPLKLSPLEQAILRQVAGNRFVPATNVVTLTIAEYLTGAWVACLALRPVR